MYHSKDNLLSGITYDDLITAVLSNEHEINEELIKKVYNEILQEQLHDARYLLKLNMGNIIKELEDNIEK